MTYRSDLTLIKLRWKSERKLSVSQVEKLIDMADRFLTMQEHGPNNISGGMNDLFDGLFGKR